MALSHTCEELKQEAANSPDVHLLVIPTPLVLQQWHLACHAAVFAAKRKELDVVFHGGWCAFCLRAAGSDALQNLRSDIPLEL